jgi:hypothetical protein
MLKLLSFIILPICMLIHAESALAVSAVYYNDTPFCICIQSHSAVSARTNGPKNCVEKGKTASSATGDANYIRSVEFSVYATQSCQGRTKANEVKELHTQPVFHSTLGRATHVYFSASAQKKVVDNKEVVQLVIHKVSPLSFCDVRPDRDQCLKEHDSKVARAQSNKTIVIAAVAVVGVAVIVATVGPAALPILLVL